MEPLFDNSIHPYCLRIIIVNHELSQPEHDRLEIGLYDGESTVCTFLPVLTECI
jgi:hypothetical protein